MLKWLRMAEIGGQDAQNGTGFPSFCTVPDDRLAFARTDPSLESSPAAGDEDGPQSTC